MGAPQITPPFFAAIQALVQSHVQLVRYTTGHLVLTDGINKLMQGKHNTEGKRGNLLKGLKNKENSDCPKWSKNSAFRLIKIM